MTEHPPIHFTRSEEILLQEDGSWASTETCFVQIYHSILSSGLLASLKGNDIKLLLALGLHTQPLGTTSESARLFFDDLLARGVVRPEDRGKLACFVEHEELAELAGIHPNTLTVCARRLERRGLIRICPVTKKGAAHWNLYLILPSSHLDRFYTYHPPATITKNVIVEAAQPSQIGTDNIEDCAAATTTDADGDLDDRFVLDYFARRKQVSTYRPTAHDLRRLRQLHKAGISQSAVIAAIDQAFDTRPPDAPPIRQFAYCAAIALRGDTSSPREERRPCPDRSTTGPAAPAAAPPASALSTDTPPVLECARALYAAEIGPLTPLIEQELRALAFQFPSAEDWERAFAEAVRNNVRKLSYISAVLKKQKPTGVPKRRNDHDPSKPRRRTKAPGWTPEQLAEEQARGSRTCPLSVAEVLGTAGA